MTVALVPAKQADDNVVDENVLANIVDDINIQPTATQKHKINAFTVRLFSAIESLSDNGSGVRSVRTHVKTEATMTF